MTEHDLLDDLTLLGLEEGAGPEAVRQAYAEMKTLYGEDSLATYTLLDEEEREELLARIEGAYRRIAGRDFPAQEMPGGEPALKHPPSPNPEELESHPGHFLRKAREQVGMSLREIAERTKIGVRRLQHIEDEQFDQLPAPVFLRGFVLQFSETVGIADPAEVARSYLEKLEDDA